jgi:uncharacterized protein
MHRPRSPFCRGKVKVPKLLAIYAFGSRVQGTAGPASDLDLATCPVDLLDLRAASTVMQYQIITTGERWWASDVQAALYEAAVLSDKTELDTARAGLLADIQRTGTIHGK